MLEMGFMGAEETAHTFLSPGILHLEVVDLVDGSKQFISTHCTEKMFPICLVVQA